MQLQEHIADKLLKDDTRALANIRFQQGAFVSEDRSMIRYLRYVRSFPTNDPFALVVLIGPERSGSTWRGKEF